MKVLLKIVGVLTAIAAMVILLAIGYNATDEELSPEVAKAQEGFTPREGFPNSRLSELAKSQPDSTWFATHDRYLINPPQWDQTLEAQRHHVETLIEAFQQGQTAVVESFNLRDASPLYPIRSHKYFLIHLSQLIHKGEKGEAIDLLEKSNHYLKSFISAPTTLTSQLVAIGVLKTNFTYLISLKETGVTRNFTESLKTSLRIEKTADEIIDASLRRELQIELSSVLQKNESLGSLWDRLSFRPNQTANWLVKLHQEKNSPACQGKTLSECSSTYREEIDTNSIKSNSMNPMGRVFTLYLTPIDRVAVKAKIDGVRELVNGL